MSSRYPERSLSDFVSFFNGKSIKPGGIGDVPAYGSNGLIGMSEQALYENAIIVGRVGAYCGSVAYCSTPFWASDNSIVARPSGDDCDTRFLFFLLKHLNLNRWAGGAAQPLLTHTVLKQVKAPHPPLPIQRRIASILSAYDDLIENNNRRIRLLKEIAGTIFKSAAAQVDGWEDTQIQEVYEGLFDGPHATPKPSDTGPVFLGIKNVTERGELDLSDIRHIAEEDFSQWTRRVQPQEGDIVFTYEATLHRYAVINRDFRGCLGRRLALIRPKRSRIDSFLLLRCLLSEQWRKQVQSKVISGVTVDRIPLITFPAFIIRVPKPELQARIGPAIRGCEELAENCRRRNDVLRATRDLLLPKLISGELDVGAVE